MHLNEEQLQRVLHGEPVEPALPDHLAGCAECRGLVTAAGREEEKIFRQLAVLDSEPPAIGPDDIVTLAMVRPTPAPPFRVQRWAAAAVLTAVVAGAAYAIPGSPVKAWVDRVVASFGSRPVVTGPDTRDAPVAAPLSGIAVDPGLGFTILFSGQVEQARARVRLSEGGQVVVAAPAGRVGFTAEDHRLRIAVRGDSTTVDIEIPRRAPRVEILVGPRRLLLKEGDQIITRPVAREDSSTYLLPLQ